MKEDRPFTASNRHKSSVSPTFAPALLGDSHLVQPATEVIYASPIFCIVDCGQELGVTESVLRKTVEGLDDEDPGHLFILLLSE